MGGAQFTDFDDYLTADHRYCQEITKHLNARAQKGGFEHAVPEFCTLAIAGPSATFEYRTFSEVNDLPGIRAEMYGVAVSCISQLRNILSLHGEKDIIVANFSVYGAGSARSLGKYTAISIDPPYPELRAFVGESAEGLVKYFAASQYSYAYLPYKFAVVQLEIIIGGPQMDPTFYEEPVLERMLRAG